MRGVARAGAGETARSIRSTGAGCSAGGCSKTTRGCSKTAPDRSKSTCEGIGAKITQAIERDANGGDSASAPAAWRNRKVAAATLANKTATPRAAVTTARGCDPKRMRDEDLRSGSGHGRDLNAVVNRTSFQRPYTVWINSRSWGCSNAAKAFENSATVVN
jgi:hypothetical protein